MADSTTISESPLLDRVTGSCLCGSVRFEVVGLAARSRAGLLLEQAAARPASEDLARTALANTAPRGQAPQTFAYPATATTGPAKVWCGLLLLFVGLLAHLLRQSEPCETERATAPAPR